MNIPDKKEMRHLGQNAYTDGTLVYKFYSPLNSTSSVEVEALKRVRDIEGVQKYVDFLPKENILITQLAPGHLLNEKSPEFKSKSASYSEDHLINLFRTISQMHKREVVFEPHARNLLYDPSKGFTPIDYTLDNGTINLRGILNILALKNVPSSSAIPGYWMPKNANLENIAQLEQLILGSFKKADPELAANEIQNLEAERQSLKSFIESFSLPKAAYKI